MRKKDWRKTTKVRIGDAYIRYEYCIVVAVLVIILQIIVIINSLDIYDYEGWGDFKCVAIVLAISIYAIIFMPPTSREIYARVQCAVFCLESSDELECKRATATLVQHKGKSYLLTSAYAVLSEGKEVYERIECGLMSESLLREIFHKVEVVKYDNELDIAILKFKASEKYLNPYILPLKWKTVRKLKGGDKVYLIGNAQGNGVCISSGIVSLPLIDEKSYHNYYIQSTVNSADGMCGGALLDNRGRLVGIHKRGGIEMHNFQFSIPIDKIIEFIEEP